MRTALLSLLALAAPLRAADLSTLPGKSVSGDVSAVGQAGVTLKTAAGDVAVPAAEALVLDLKTPTAEADATQKVYLVELIDGSQVFATAVGMGPDTLTLTTSVGELAVPLVKLAWLLRDAQDAQNRQALSGMLSKRGRSDLLLVRKGPGVFDAVEGTVSGGDAAAGTVKFDAANGAGQKPRLSRIAGLIFSAPAPGGLEEPLCRVYDTRRNVLVAKSVEYAGKDVKVVTAAGLAVTYPSLAALSKVDFSKGKVSFLSDLTASRVSGGDGLVPAAFAFRKDRKLNGRPIALGGQPHAKGLTLAAGTEVSYDLAGEFQEFRALVGVDDAVLEGRASATLRVEGDGRELLVAEVKKKSPPARVAVPVRDVRTLRIQVLGGGPGLVEQVTLADAKVSK